MELNATSLIDDYLDGELNEQGGERLRAWLEADEKNVRLFVRHVYFHRQLRDWALAENIGKCLDATCELPVDAASVSSRNEQSSAPRRSWSWRALACALVGAAVGSWVTWQLAMHRQAAGTVAGAGLQLGGNGAPYMATLVSVTNCRWDQSRSTADLSSGSAVRSGESLHLLEGVAEMSCTLDNGGVASLQLEGPLAMTLSSHGMPNLLFGQLTGSFTCDYDEFVLDTPLGRIAVSGDASIGVIAAANKVELHVFSGTATLEPWDIGLVSATEMSIATAGNSVVARVNSEGRVELDSGKSREGRFMTPAALAASRLHISDEYVSTIVGAQPVAYWRFENDSDGMMRNELGDRLHCRVVGDAVRWRGGEQNSTAEFGMTVGPGYLMSDDVLDGIIHDVYSVELWAKPTYHHHGALFSLIAWIKSESPHGAHRVHLELCGPVSGFATPYRPTESHPGRVRFIHETAEIFSSLPYAVRKWQHIVATKEASTMRLYVDGQLAATGEDERVPRKGLYVLMGQLYPQSPHLTDEVTSRLFVGELDEVALYNRVLREDEIKRHFELAQPIRATREDQR
jgi:hypothetical protein